MSMSDNVVFSYIEGRPADPGVGGDVFTDGVDMEGYDGCLFIVASGVMTGPGADINLQIQQSDDDGATDAYADVGSPLTILGASPGMLAVADVIRPAQRWLRGRLTWDITNSEPNGVIAIRYGGRRGNLGKLDGAGFSIESTDVFHLLKMYAPT